MPPLLENFYLSVDKKLETKQKAPTTIPKAGKNN